VGLTLVIGNKNYSSWSLRPWIAMKVANLTFDEIVIPLYEAGSAEKILQHSPAGKVPVLVDDGVAVWESLAILEHLADRFPVAELWPKDRAARCPERGGSWERKAGLQRRRDDAGSGGRTTRLCSPSASRARCATSPTAP
jgi:glutathione S-transferase